MPHFRESAILCDKLLIAGTYVADNFVATLAHLFSVGEDELHIDNLYVLIGLNGIVYMRDVRVVKEADDLEYRVGLADVREELVPEPLPLCRALHEPGDVNKFYRRRNCLLAF